MATAQDIHDFYDRQRVKLSPEARSLIADDQSDRAYYDLLRSRDLLPDARRVLAHVLPKRHALWWACLCVRDGYGEKVPDDLRSILRAVSMYVTHQSEDWRREAGRLGKQARQNTLQATLAMAAYFAGELLTPPPSLAIMNLPPALQAVMPRPRPVELPPFLTSRLVGVAIYLAATQKNPLYKPVLRHYLDVGVTIARGENLWPMPQKQESLPEMVNTEPAAHATSAV